MEFKMPNLFFFIYRLEIKIKNKKYKPHYNILNTFCSFWLDFQLYLPTVKHFGLLTECVFRFIYSGWISQTGSLIGTLSFLLCRTYFCEYRVKSFNVLLIELINSIKMRLKSHSRVVFFCCTKNTHLDRCVARKDRHVHYCWSRSSLSVFAVNGELHRISAKHIWGQRDSFCWISVQYTFFYLYLYII